MEKIQKFKKSCIYDRLGERVSELVMGSGSKSRVRVGFGFIPSGSGNFSRVFGF